MDLLATVITATVIATGGAQQHHIPQTQSPNPIDQARFGYAQAQRLQYLTSEKGREYWREQLQIEQNWRLGGLPR